MDQDIDLAQQCHPERSEGSPTDFVRHAIDICVINGLLRDPSSRAAGFGMTA
jgi:hypothetical protein